MTQNATAEYPPEFPRLWPVGARFFDGFRAPALSCASQGLQRQAGSSLLEYCPALRCRAFLRVSE